MTETHSELGRNPEANPKYEAIVIPSYGMSKDKEGTYKLSFFSGVACRASYELWKDGVAPIVIIEGATIFPGDPKNDGDLMKALLLKLGMPEDAILQRRNNTNTYNQILDSKRTVEEMNIRGRVLTVFCDLHKQRIPNLIENYHINSDTRIAEDVLSERYPAFARVWQIIKNDPTYKEKIEKVEAKIAKALRVDPQGMLARVASWVLFPITGADVADVKHRKITRVFAKTGKSH